MADISITPANVVKVTLATVSEKKSGVAGETIDAGEFVYKDTADDDEYKLADTDSATEIARTPSGMALNSASDGQPIDIATSGQVNVGAVLTAATVYYLSGNAGKMCLIADVQAGDYVCAVGIAISDSILDIKFLGGSVVLA